MILEAEKFKSTVQPLVRVFPWLKASLGENAWDRENGGWTDLLSGAQFRDNSINPFRRAEPLWPTCFQKASLSTTTMRATKLPTHELLGNMFKPQQQSKHRKALNNVIGLQRQRNNGWASRPKNNNNNPTIQDLSKYLRKKCLTSFRPLQSKSLH